MRDAKKMDFLRLIQDLHRRSKYRDVKEAYTEMMAGYPEGERPFSRALLTTIIHQDQKPSVSKCIEVAFMYGATSEQIVTALEVEKDRIYSRLISPVALPADVQDIADRFMKLPTEKRKLVSDLLNTIGG